MSDAPLAEIDRHPDRGLGKAFVLGSLIGFVVVFAIFGGLSLVAGLDAPAAAGLGFFTAVWGGPGFGGMMGAVLHHESEEDTLHDATAPAVVGGAAG